MNLFVLSNAVNFIGVAQALWLGFFNVTRSPQRALARAAALTLWAGAGYLLSNIMYYNQLPESNNTYWSALFRWSTCFGPALWLHLTACLLPRPTYEQRRRFVLVAYIAAGIFTALDTATPLLLSAWNQGTPFAGSSKSPGVIFPLFVAYLLGCITLITINLIQARRQAADNHARRRPIDQMTIGSMFAGVGGVYLTGIVQFGLAAPNVLGDLALTSGLLLMGYAVAQVAALLDGRSVKRDFLYTLLAITLVCGAYLFATLLSYIIYGIPFVTFIFVLMLAVASHSTYDWARTTLDRFFFRAPTRELRANLRALAHEAGSEQNVRQNLRALLTTLCQSVGASRGLLLVRDGEQFVADATYRMSAPPQPIAPSVVHGTELTALDGATALGDMALLAPLRLMEQQEGALVIAPKEHGGNFSDDDHFQCPFGILS